MFYFPMLKYKQQFVDGIKFLVIVRLRKLIYILMFIKVCDEFVLHQDMQFF